jgi:hypothetical protein
MTGLSLQRKGLQASQVAVLGFVLLAFAPLAAQAQVRGLTGLQSARIVIEDLDEEARQCGVTRDTLDAAARITLSNSRLRVDNGDVGPYYYVQVTVLRSGTYCMAAINVALTRPVWLRPGAQTQDVVLARVWSRGGVISGGEANFGRRVMMDVEGYTKQFLGSWLREN